MSELIALSAVLVMVALIFWLASNSDDDNGGGGLMEPALVPVRVRRY